MTERPRLGELAAYGRERAEDADWNLRGLHPDTGEAPVDLDELLDAEMERA